jgi:hypothetical protein
VASVLYGAGAAGPDDGGRVGPLGPEHRDSDSAGCFGSTQHAAARSGRGRARTFERLVLGAEVGNLKVARPDELEVPDRVKFIARSSYIYFTDKPDFSTRPESLGLATGFWR